VAIATATATTNKAAAKKHTVHGGTSATLASLVNANAGADAAAQEEALLEIHKREMKAEVDENRNILAKVDQVESVAEHAADAIEGEDDEEGEGEGEDAEVPAADEQGAAAETSEADEASFVEVGAAAQLEREDAKEEVDFDEELASGIEQGEGAHEHEEEQDSEEEQALEEEEAEDVLRSEEHQQDATN
jgi:hypothetical protein